MGRPKSGTNEILELFEDLQENNSLISPSAVLIACRTLASTALMAEENKWSTDALRIATKYKSYSDSEYSKYLFTIIQSVALYVEGNLNQAYEKAISAIYIAETSSFTVKVFRSDLYPPAHLAIEYLCSLVEVVSCLA